MRALVKRFLDNDISRRHFLMEMTSLGVALASAEALVDSLWGSLAAEAAESSREVTGNGADILMETFLESGVDCIFHGNGGGTIRFFDAIATRPEIKNFLATNEGQAVAMAEGYHLASGGKLGIAIIPKPGLGNAAGNIYNALVNRSSLLILSARDSGETSERQGDLEFVDWEEVMDPFMKWSYRMYSIDRVTEFANRAIKVAMTPPGGPSFLQMNEDLYEQEITTKILSPVKFQISSKIKPDPNAVTDLAKALIDSKSPLITAGFEVTKSGASEKMIELAELLAIPVTQGLSGFVDFPNQHPLALGRYSPFLPQARTADFYLSIGSPMPDMSSYVHSGGPPPKAKLGHISLEPNQLSAIYPTDFNILADANEAISDLIEAVKSLATSERITSIKNERYDTIRAYTEDRRKKVLDGALKTWDDAPMSTARISTDLDELLDDDAIIVSEPIIGSTDWFDFGNGRKQWIGVLGAAILGWATGAALGAKLANPDRQVVALSGDGAFMFQHSLWSLARYSAPVIVVIYNNRAYNTSRAFQWRGAQAKMQKDMVNYLGNPDVDFSDIAKGYGVAAEVVKDPSDLRPAIQRAIQATRDGKPYLLDVANVRWGPGGELESYPKISIAEMRTKKV